MSKTAFNNSRREEVDGDELNFEEEEETGPVPKEIKSYVEADRWKDEDQEDDIKDNWDDEDEEENDEEEKKPVTITKKKPLKEKIKEKEEKRRQAEAELEALANRVKSPEEILAEKLERQRLQEESDLMLAKDTFGVGVPSNCLSEVELISKSNFEDFRKLLVEKLATAEKSPLYVGFLESLFRDLCAGMEVDDIKRLSSSLNALYNEKIKAQKSAKPKKKALVKSSIKLERNNLQPEYDDEYMNEYEEFL